MRKYFLAFIAMLNLCGGASASIVQPIPYVEISNLHDVTRAAFSIFQTYSGPPQITCDLVTGVASVGGPCTSGATCNGVADAAPAFWQFRTWALANQGTTYQTVLNIPAGSDCLFNTNAGTVGGPLGGVQNTFVAGIHNLLVDGGSGVTLRAGAAGYWLGNFGVCQEGITGATGCSARIQTANAGASTVTLTAASLSAGYISRFTTGDWIMFGGLDTQGLWDYSCGFPPNQTYYEWRQITNVNAGTGVITLDRPLTNTYLDTWPSYNSGAPPGTPPTSSCSPGEADNGGPATIWRVGFAGAEWSNVAEFRGITFNQPTNQIYATMRSVTYRNVTFTGGGLGGLPTQNETFAAYNVTWVSSSIEVDKLIGTFICDNCTVNNIDFQSNSVDLFQLSNSNIAINLVGGGKRTEITDTNITNWYTGSVAYGNSTGGPIVCTRCNVTNFFNEGIFQNDNPSPYSMSGGVISFPNTAATGGGPAQRWASTIGTRIFFGTDGANPSPSGVWDTLASFTVLGVTQDATNTYIQTDLAGGFPDWTTLSPAGTHIQFRAGAQQFTCDACTGDPLLVAMNIQNGATPLAPAETYSRRSYTPSAGNISAGQIKGVGKLTSYTINVTQAYTGSGSVSLRGTAEFLFLTAKQSNWTTFDWMPTINLKQAGERVITPGGVTCDGVPGGCAGDTINGTNGYPPEAVWLFGAMNPYIDGAFSGGVNPQFTLTLQTDQTP